MSAPLAFLVLAALSLASCTTGSFAAGPVDVGSGTGYGQNHP